MTLSPGTRLGPYEIVGAVGAGGMGEVWKARDPKLERFVAIKVLPEDFAADGDRLKRFQQEAKALAALNHPNLVQVFESGEHEGAPYLVMELLEGETLREKLRGKPLSPKRASEIAREAALGLSAAHEKGILHRDLKPENLFLTKDGRVKLLDFGLAKFDTSRRIGQESATRAFLSEPGTVVGTTGYMSPEQVRGEAVDARSDLFSLGVILWEMVTGQRPFKGDSSVEVMHAILKEDPPELDAGLKLSPTLERILHGCLAKEPAGRFHSAHDLAFALENATQSSLGSGTSFALRSSRPRTAPWKTILLCAGLLIAGVLGGWWARSPKPEPTFKQLTFRRGNILTARFTPDGQSVIYSATWDGRPTELYLARLDGTSTRPLGLSKAFLQGVSSQGELLVILRGEGWGAGGEGTLAQLPMEGGSPREILERVRSADFGPDGKEIAVAYQTAPSSPQRLDFPLGRRLLEMAIPSLGSVRVSPKGDLVAFTNWDDETDTTELSVVDRQGKRRTLLRLPSPEFENGPLWSPDAKELYFMAGGTLRAVDLGGKARVLRWDSGFRALHDVSSQGRFLLERFIMQQALAARRNGKEVDLSYSDNTLLCGLSSDGGQVMINEFGGAGASRGKVGIRRTDGSPPKLLGTGYGLEQSPDGQWVVMSPMGNSEHLNLAPTGTGVTRELRHPGWTLLAAVFTPDSRRLIVLGRKLQGEVGLLRFSVDGGPAELLAAKAAFSSMFCSEDGDHILTQDEQRRPVLRPLAGGADRSLAPPLAEGESILAWDLKDRALVGRLTKPVSVPVDLLDLRTGQRKAWQAVGPADPSGVVSINNFKASRDFGTLAYAYRRVITSDLFVGDGLR